MYYLWATLNEYLSSPFIITGNKIRNSLAIVVYLKVQYKLTKPPAFAGRP